jgi:hypothetical protein
MQRGALKIEMKRNLRQMGRSSLKKLRFAPDEFKELEWEDASEFRWKGNLYDVVEKTDSSGFSLISCIADEKETALLDGLMKANENAHHQGRSIIQLITKIFTRTEITPAAQPVICQNPDWNLFDLKFCSRYQSQPSQPPEYC